MPLALARKWAALAPASAGRYQELGMSSRNGSVELLALNAKAG